ncbi:(d)CMP kinase [Mycoplasmopsis lipofaciens]|uniref:(d)CMP kinase n=1 Tax=Mycoplasmopsis lipofaciens TaxID=114884 RepID=UPI0004887EE6|nr:(d)CMP kinase [Mycoplasmopsis lipofaciens]
MKKINIAIDGPAGAGKSTVSKELAKKLKYTFINTGSVYRAIALYAKNQNISWENESEINNILIDNIIQIDEKEHVYLQNIDVSHDIRNDEISKGSSKIAQYKNVREYVVKFIQEITKIGKGYIMDGRDTTFKIMPHAEVKIFLTAKAEERARRRILQNKELGFKEDYNTVLEEVRKRDYQDSHREVDPLHKVEDAIEIECTNMTYEEVVNKIIDIVEKRINEK